MPDFFFFHNCLLEIKMLRPGLLGFAAPWLEAQETPVCPQPGGRGRPNPLRGGPRAPHQQKCLCLFLGDRPEERRMKRRLFKIKNDQKITGFGLEEED